MGTAGQFSFQVSHAIAAWPVDSQSDLWATEDLTKLDTQDVCPSWLVIDASCMLGLLIKLSM